MNFLVDNQLPPALARFLSNECKQNAIHVLDLGLRDGSDSELWSYASTNNLILISKDEDFANMILTRPTAKLIWVRVGNCRKLFLLDLFRRMWPRIIGRRESGELFIEIR